MPAILAVDDSVLTYNDYLGTNLESLPTFENLNFTNMRLTDAVIHNGDFRGANLTGVDFSAAYLAGCDFRNANLTGANLSHADLTDCDFRHSILDNANLRHATLDDTNFGTNRSLRRNIILPTDGGICDSSGRWAESICERCACDRDGNCECMHCDRCGPCDSEGFCTDCDRCNDHCHCSRCDRCGNRGDSICGDCANCEDCGCRCNTGGLSSRDPGRPYYAHRKDERRTFDCTRLVGVELEYNRCEDTDPLERWVDEWRSGHHEDGSCGYEVVTAPMAGDHIDHALTSWARAMRNSNAECNDSCGIHVHVDAGDLTWEDMFRLLPVYAKVEPLFYLLAGQGRLRNDYCSPCGGRYLTAMAQEDRKGAIMAVTYQRQTPQDARAHVKRHKPGKKDGGRYKGLNLCPWLAGRRFHDHAPDTTIEFRMHRNSLDGARVAGWAKLLARFVDWISKSSQAQVDALPKSALRALCIIAPDCKPWILSRLKDYRANCKPRRRLIRVTGGSWRTI